MKDFNLLLYWLIIPLIVIAGIDIGYQITTNDCAPKIPFCTDQ